MHNRLQWEESPQIREELATERERRSRSGVPAWLRTRFPPPESPALLRTITVEEATRPGSLGVEGVLSCAFSPDGRTVVTACSDLLKLWDVSSGVELLTLQEHDDTVWACAFSPDGTRVVSAGHDHTLRLWDTTTGGQVAVLRGHFGPVVDCAFSPDGGRVVSASWDNTARIWDLATGGGSIVVSPSDTPEEEIEAGGDYRCRVDACAFSPDGRSILTAANGLEEWDAATGDRIRALPGDTCCAYSPDGRQVLGLDHKPYLEYPVQVLVQDLVGAGEKLETFHETTVRPLTFSPDSRRYITAGDDRMLRIWDVATGLELTALTGHSGAVRCCAYSPDSTLLASGGDDGTLRLWDATRLEHPADMMRHEEDAIHACAFSHDGHRIVSGSENLHDVGGRWHRNLMVWNAETGTPLGQPKGHDGGVAACAFSPDDTLVASVSKRLENVVAVWDSTTGREVRKLTYAYVVAGCAFSPSGTEIMAASWDGTVRVWDMSDGSEMAPLVGGSNVTNWETLHCCAVSPDGRWVAAGGYQEPEGADAGPGAGDGLLRLWDFRSKVEVGVLAGVENPIDCCAFSPDGQLLLAGAVDGTLTIYDAATLAVVSVLSGHSHNVRSCAFSADGTWVVSGGDDGTARVWDPATGRQLATFPVVGAVLAVATHPRLPRFACGGTAGVLYVVDLINP
jgi:WD40 repeat protein